MKKFSIVLFVLCSVLFSSCSYLNDCFYMFVKNETNQEIKVTIKEDPETYVSRVMGPQVQTLTLSPGQTKRTNIVDNSFFKILVNNKVVDYVNDSGSITTRNGDYNLIGSNALVVIKKIDEKYYYDWTF